MGSSFPWTSLLFVALPLDFIELSLFRFSFLCQREIRPLPQCSPPSSPPPVFSLPLSRWVSVQYLSLFRVSSQVYSCTPLSNAVIGIDCLRVVGHALLSDPFPASVFVSGFAIPLILGLNPFADFFSQFSGYSPSRAYSRKPIHTFFTF